MKNKLLSGMVLFMVSAAAMAQQSFSTPDQATDALATAISEQNESAMNNLLGENWREFLPPEGVDPDAVDRFLRDWNVRHTTVVEGDTAHLVVGDSGWQLPIPVIKTSAGWQFDIKEGAEEILTREIGRNELAAIEALHAYVDAQQSYFAMNQKYAQKIVSSKGKKDGLYWPASPGEAPSPLGLQQRRVRREHKTGRRKRHHQDWDHRQEGKIGDGGTKLVPHAVIKALGRAYQMRNHGKLLNSRGDAGDGPQRFAGGAWRFGLFGPGFHLFDGIII